MSREPDILTRIESNLNVFTRSEIKVAHFVLEKPRQALYTSITDLAEQCGVGDTTVFRFCKTLKLKGYQEFKMLLAQALAAGSGQTAGLDQNRITEEDSPEVVARKTLQGSMVALQKTFDLIDYEALGRVTDILVNAPHVLVCGAGSSLITAFEVASKFLRITDKFFFSLDTHLQAMSAASLRQGAAVLMISFSGATKDMVHIAKLAKAQNACVISVTRFAKSPLASVSDITLICGANEDPLQGGSLSGKMAQLLLLDILYNQYFVKTYAASTAQNEKAAAAVLEKLY